LLLAAGQHPPYREQVESFRRAVDDPARFLELQALRTELQSAGFELDTTLGVKTATRGWPRDHRELAHRNQTHRLAYIDSVTSDHPLMKVGHHGGACT